MRWPRNKDQLFALLVILPSLVLVAIFVYGFIAQNLYTSLTDWGRDPAQALSANPVIRFIGLDNYRELFTGLIDSRFRQDLVNTIFFTLFFIAGCLGLGLALAILLDRKPKGESALRTIFLFPMSLSFIVTGTIWRWLLQPQGGVNRLPTLVGLPPGRFAWLTSRQQILHRLPGQPVRQGRGHRFPAAGTGSGADHPLPGACRRCGTGGVSPRPGTRSCPSCATACC